MTRSSLLLVLILGGCGSPITQDQCAALMTDHAIIERCANGRMAGPWKNNEDCYPLLKPERMTGIFITGFERAEFFLGASAVKPAMSRYDYGTWLDFSKQLDWHGIPRPVEPGAYLVTFEGRRSACAKADGSLFGYGHIGAYRDYAVVDRVISWRPVDGPPSDQGS